MAYIDATIAFIVELFTHKIFLSGLFGWFIAQASKTFFLAMKEGHFSFKLLLRRASMPSSHASTVAALTTAMFLSEGITAVSILCFFFSFVVLRDVLDINIGVPSKSRIGLNLKTYIHKPLEVIIGGIIGIAVAVIVHAL